MESSSRDPYSEIADLYDHVVLYASRDDVGFFVDEARASGGPVLEIGSGTGRVLIPTARAGIEITGLDASPAMLAACRTRLEPEPEDVRGRVSLVLGDMRAFDLGREFALVTIPFRPFMHLLTVDDQLACLAAVRRHLRAGGRFIFDLFNPKLEALVQPVGEVSLVEPEFTTPDGRRVVRKHRTVARNHFSQVSDFELIYDVTHPGGRTEQFVQAFQLRHLFRHEAEHLLVRAGFTVEHVYAGYDRAPYGSVYPGDLIFVARKGP